MEGKFTMSVKLFATGFTLAALAMVGCQQTEPQNSLVYETDATTVEALRLGIKVSDSCKAELQSLHEAFSAAKGDSTLKADLIAKHADFVGACVEKSEPVAKDGRIHLSHPPVLTRDSADCAWKVDAIDDQDSTVEVHYRHECADRGAGMEGHSHDSTMVRPEKPVKDLIPGLERPTQGGGFQGGFEGVTEDCDSNHVAKLPRAPKDSSEAE